MTTRGARRPDAPAAAAPPRRSRRGPLGSVVREQRRAVTAIIAVAGRHDEDGAVGVMEQRGRRRPEQRPRERALPARAADDQIGIRLLRGLGDHPPGATPAPDPGRRAQPGGVREHPAVLGMLVRPHLRLALVVLERARDDRVGQRDPGERAVLERRRLGPDVQHDRLGAG
jgi:hypothetical protein